MRVGSSKIESVGIGMSWVCVFRFSDKTVWKFADLGICCQRQKYSPETLAFGNISVMQLFTVVCSSLKMVRETGELYLNE